MENIISEIQQNTTKYKIFVAMADYFSTKDKCDNIEVEFSNTLNEKYADVLKQISDYAKSQREKNTVVQEGNDVDSIFDNDLNDRDKDEQLETGEEKPETIEEPPETVDIESSPLEVLADDLLDILFKKLSRKLHPDKCRTEESKYQEVINKAKEHSDLIKILAVAYHVNLPMEDIDLDFYNDAIEHHISIMNSRVNGMKNSIVWKWKYATSHYKDTIEVNYLHQMNREAAAGKNPNTKVKTAS